MSDKKKDKKPKLESKEEPVINYGNPPVPPKENIGLTQIKVDREKNIKKGEEKALLDRLSGNLDPNTTKLFQCNISYNSEDDLIPYENGAMPSVEDRVFELESELRFKEDAYAKVFAKYQELTKNFTDLQAAYKQLSEQPKFETFAVDPAQAELDNIKTSISSLHTEFLNEVAGRNSKRERRDIIFLTGEYGLISKFKKAFSFLQ
jgi:chromosome segregation ATPase